MTSRTAIENQQSGLKITNNRYIIFLNKQAFLCDFVLQKYYFYEIHRQTNVKSSIKCFAVNLSGSWVEVRTALHARTSVGWSDLLPVGKTVTTCVTYSNLPSYSLLVMIVLKCSHPYIAPFLLPVVPDFTYTIWNTINWLKTFILPSHYNSRRET